MSRYEQFDRSRLLVKPLAERTNDLHLDRWLALGDPTPPFAHPDLAHVAAHLAAAKASGAARILMMGAHVLRAGVNRHLIDMLQRRFIDHIAMNGAGAIHDYELARFGATTESVDRYIRSGEFGLWRETGELNDWIREAAENELGLGENVGRRIAAGDYPYRELSVFAAAWNAGDTNVFGDMAIIRDLYTPDIAMLPIGDHFTMSPREAAYACNLLNVKTVIPMHFGTFPQLTGTPSALQKLVPGIEIVEMTPGMTIGG